VISSMIAGFWRPGAGWRWVNDRPDLRALLFLPMAVLAVLLALGTVLAIGWTGPWIASFVKADATPGLLGALHRALDAIWTPIAYLLALAMTGVGSWLVSRVLSEPVYDELSQLVDAEAGGSAPAAPEGMTAILLDAARGLAHTAIGVSLWASASCLLLVLNLIPVVGSVLNALGSWCLAAFLLSLEALDFPLSRRRYSYLGKLAWAWARRSEAIGFGAAMGLALLIPGAIFLVLPAAIAAATLWVVEEERREGRQQR
jgi:CysZ protein